MSPGPYDLTTHDGHTVDWLTKMALVEVEGRLGYPLNITQGSYAPGFAASGTTHDQGGVVDGYPRDPAREVLELRRAGFAAFDRLELWRDGKLVWRRHWHAVQIGNRKLAPAARAQVIEYLAGGDGLLGDAPDTGPRQFLDRRFEWRTGARRIGRARALVARADALLATKVRGYPRAARARRQLRRSLDQLEQVDVE